MYTVDYILLNSNPIVTSKPVSLFFSVSKANTAMHETMALDKAVEKALSMVDTKETLIIVTADHGHTMSMSGYQLRGADIRSMTCVFLYIVL
jgi:alkaline phosphatase